MTTFMRCCAAAVLAGAPLVTSIYINGNVIAPCDSPLYCYGDVLQQVQLAKPFSDSKTFIDLPTTSPLNEVLAAFANLTKPIQNDSALHDFLTTYFSLAGSELEAVPKDELNTQPDFLANVRSPIVAQFARKVIDIWPDLTRRYVGAGNCPNCVSSFIPVNRTFVVAGGRFREPYYWDSFWIIEGLLRTQGTFTQIAENIIENFLDLVQTIGFVPNGARQYYLNRSQPPLLTQMVRIYVEYTHNYTILERALPLLEEEYRFFANNRTATIQREGRNYTLNCYAVRNNQPRPESYYEDYQTANNDTYYNMNGDKYDATSALDDAQKAKLYANLASGAESGWDYSSRWIANPDDAVEDIYFPLRSLNTMNIIPVDLNSILYYNEITIANLYKRTGNFTAANTWAELARNRRRAMTALLWNSQHYNYFDYNLTSHSQNIYNQVDNTSTILSLSGAPPDKQVAFQASQFFPFWTGAAPDNIKNRASVMRRVYARVEEMLQLNPGGVGTTNLRTGQQWDEPNVWPPLQYILIQGLLNIPHQIRDDDNESSKQDYAWGQKLALTIAQRYVDSLYCTWRSTGGSLDSAPQVSGATGNGTIFEKYSESSTNAAGSGGEYTVVEGFGWSNGVLIWIVDQFGQQLSTPDCGNLTAVKADSSTSAKKKRSALHVDSEDAKWMKKMAR